MCCVGLTGVGTTSIGATERLLIVGKYMTILARRLD